MLRKTRSSSGFTIIEVVITIAIGAAVMALVLNAVAGARRSQRNNARVADIGTITGAVNDYIANRNALPTEWGNIDNTIEDLNQYVVGGDGTSAANALGITLLTKGLAAGDHPYIAAIPGTSGATPNFSVDFPAASNPLVAAAPATPAATSIWGADTHEDRHDKITIIQSAKCNAANDGIEYGGLRRIVILYKLEGQDGITCRDI